MSELALALTLRLFRATGIGMNYRGERPSFRAPTRSRHERVPCEGGTRAREGSFEGLRCPARGIPCDGHAGTHGEEELPRALRGTSGMNTTKLIALWTMEGASLDVGGCFRAADDIGIALASDDSTSKGAVAGSFFIKGADGDKWHSLEDEGHRA